MAVISIFFSLLCSSCLVFAIFVSKAQAFGFTADLVHRDSPQSPFYNPSSTKMDRLNNAIKRSLSRAAHFKQSFSQSPNTIQSQIIAASGEYLMKLSIGTPPVQTLVIADTGSDLTWTQCEPCTQCYEQNAPLFNSKNSSTYRELSCQSQPCQDLSNYGSCNNNICQYRMPYYDKSYSMGSLAAETFTLGSTSCQAVSIPNMVFGCGHDNEGTFQDTTTGIIGLGGGSVSLVSQLSDTINGKFSYCLSGFNGNATVPSKINFGDNAVVSGSGVVSTPIVPKDMKTLYYLTLESITVGKTTLKYETKMMDSSGQEGNIIIDSGTALTLLPSDLYEKLKLELINIIKPKVIYDPAGVLGLCFSGNNTDLPKITFKFTGAELELPPTNTFIQFGKFFCLAMIPSDDLCVFGNMSQMNLLIGYDIVKKQLSFKPTDCSKNN